MRIALQCQCLLTLASSLFVVSGLTAHAADPQPARSGDAMPPQVSDTRPPGLTPDQIEKVPIRIQLPLTEEQLKKLTQVPKMRPLPYKQEEQRDSLASVQLVLSVILALLAAIGGAWGGSKVLTKKPSPPARPPMDRVERLGLGADGKGGVWLREVAPWEK
jgi:hypothetical protein